MIADSHFSVSLTPVPTSSRITDHSQLQWVQKTFPNGRGQMPWAHTQPLEIQNKPTAKARSSKTSVEAKVSALKTKDEDVKRKAWFLGTWEQRHQLPIIDPQYLMISKETPVGSSPS